MILCSLFVNGQSPYSYTYATSNGLPSNTIYDLYQDINGFVWLCTGQGLYRYDGFEFKSYKNAKQSSVTGAVLTEDKFGRIWYENFDGFISYVENGELHNFKHNLPVGFIPFGITSKYLFVIQKKGVDVFDISSLKFVKTIRIDFELEEHAAVIKDNYYFIVDDILYKIDSQLRLTKNLYFKDKNLHIKQLYDYKGDLLIVSKLNETEKVYVFNQNLNLKTTYSLPDILTIQGIDLIDEQVWISSTNGVYVYEVESDFVLKNRYFTKSSSSSILKDSQNNYWFASTNNGIELVPELKNEIHQLNNYRPLRITPVDDGYFVSTREGDLLKINKDFSFDKVLFNTQSNYAANGVFYDSTFNNIFLYGKGFTYSEGSEFNRVKKFPVAVKDIVRLDQKYYAFSASGTIGIITHNKSNVFYKSIWDSLYIKNEDKNYFNIAKIKKGIRAKSIDYDTLNSRIAVATNIGLFIITPNSEIEVKYNNESVYADKILFKDDIVFVLDNKGNLFTVDKNNHISYFNSEIGLSANSIFRINKSNDKLLIASKNYIYTYNFQTKKIDQYDYYLNGNYINDFQLYDDQLIVLTDEGILSFSTKLKPSNKKVFFRLTDFKVKNRSYPLNAFAKLNYNQNSIEIQYSIFEFIKSYTPLYYRINKGEWVLTNKETRTIQFPSLSYDKYLIEFKLGNELQDQKIEFEITSPFWGKWWFYFIAFIAVSTILYVYFKWQNKLMKNQIKLLNEKVILEKNLSKSMMSAIKSQMNPHFFYNALNTIQAYIFTNDKLKANSYLAKFSKLTRIILEMSEKETVSLSEEVESLTLYLDLEKMRFSDSFTYEFKYENIIDKEIIEFPPMLVQPYVENAVKHGLLHKIGDKLLHIKFTKLDDLLYITIEDNGIGRKRSEELNKIKNEKHQSFSTQANEKRLEILNKGTTDKIGVEYTDKIDHLGNVLGTKVVLTIPI